MGNGGTKENQMCTFVQESRQHCTTKSYQAVREQQRCSEYPHRPWQITNWE